MGDWRQFRTEGFDLALTIKSGQFFRYYEERGGFITVTQRKTIELRQKGNALFYRGADEEFVRRFLGLVPEHEHAMARLKLDPVIAPIIARYRGLRLMRLDLHESIIGFICSSMSNIPKIRMNLHRLSASSGDSVGGHHHLPAPGKKLDHAMVLAARTGYRAKFIVEANRMLTRNMLSEIRSADYPRSHELLCALPGVGPKVADCVCLFALGHGEAFPVDVHVLRAMRVLFPRSRLTTEKRAKAFAQARWGKDAGLAQQFIFHWARNNLVKRKVLS